MKFSQSDFNIDSDYAKDLRRKTEVFVTVTGTKKNIFITMVTTYGINNNSYAKELVTISLTIDNLFWNFIISQFPVFWAGYSKFVNLAFTSRLYLTTKRLPWKTLDFVFGSKWRKWLLRQCIIKISISLKSFYTIY